MLTDEQREAMAKLAAQFGGAAPTAVREKLFRQKKDEAPAPETPGEQREREVSGLIAEAVSPVVQTEQPDIADVEETEAVTQAAIEPATALEKPAHKRSAPLTSTHPFSRQADVDNDEAWAMANLRCRDNHAFNDLANVLRIFVRHPEFHNRFRFDKSMGKVLDRGEVMLGWQIDELCAILQERFLPEIPAEIVLRSLMICANRATKPDEAA